MSNNNNWQVFDVEELRAKLSDVPVQYKEILNVPTLSCGLYHLQAGSKDMQSPHDDDEIYYVINGKAKMRLGDAERKIAPGTLLYVKASEEHSFFEIEEDMTLLIFFASKGN